LKLDPQHSESIKYIRRAKEALSVIKKSKEAEKTQKAEKEKPRKETGFAKDKNKEQLSEITSKSLRELRIGIGVFAALTLLCVIIF
jgi:hypothetical protein